MCSGAVNRRCRLKRGERKGVSQPETVDEKSPVRKKYKEVQRRESSMTDRIARRKKEAVLFRVGPTAVQRVTDR